MPKRLTQEEYLQKARSVHGDKFNYSLTNYINAHSDIIIICPYHGEFTMKACSHTNQKQGCAKCAGIVPYTTEEYIEKVKDIHGDKYDYSKTNYIRAHDKVTITCPDHGDFYQQAYVHMQGHNCPSCAKETIKEKSLSRPDIWSYSGWEEASKTSKYFVEYSVYVIEVWNENEKFLKIGKTFMSLGKRFSSKKHMPYKWKLIKKFTGSADYISELERKFHNDLRVFRYTPEITFHGSCECYREEILNSYEFNSTTTSDI